jgi:hypothetical protein
MNFLNRFFAVFGGIDFVAAGFPTIPLNQQRHILPKHWERFPLSWGRGPHPSLAGAGEGGVSRMRVDGKKHFLR